MLTAPVEAGGQFPPPHTDMFVDGRNSTEPCTWGITLDEAAALWDKHVSCTLNLLVLVLVLVLLLLLLMLLLLLLLLTRRHLLALLLLLVLVRSCH